MSFDNLFQWLIGVSQGSTYILSRFVFLRSLGVIYLIAFVSLWVQVRGLVGSNGILPVASYLEAAKSAFGADRFRILPTLFWFSASDTALHLVCALGVLFAILLICNIAPLPSVVVLWALYLSLTVAGQDFLSFQWDILLIEVGFLAIFLAPMNIRPLLAFESAVSPIALFLLWWLLFRFSFESGVVKLTSGDHTWRDLTALTYHYMTQPLPTWTAWAMHQLPLSFQKISTIVMYAIELVLPFLIFFSRSLRIVAALGMIALQVLIGATGNYNFFNLLTIALCFLLFDDALWAAVLPQKFLHWIGFASLAPRSLGEVGSPFLTITLLVAFFYLLISFFQLLETVDRRFTAPRFVQRLERFFSPFHSVNSYGLFRVMTTSRPEIIVEGSEDGTTWQAYAFKWKPGDPMRRPRFIEPHQPRLDWQMWFAALRWRGRPLALSEVEGWFQHFLGRLLQGSPEVLALMAHNPFPDHPPKYVRALLYDYMFTSAEERRRTGNWWNRRLIGNYSPILSLR